MNKVTAVDLVELLGGLDDPRAADRRRHRLGDLLVLAFCTVLCGQEEFTALARFGKPGRPEIVAVAGKRARRGGSNARAALPLVNAWAVDNGLCLGQEADGREKQL